MTGAENSLEDPRFKKTREQVTQWLQGSGYFIEPRAATEPFAWALGAGDEAGFAVNVGQYLGGPDFVRVGTRLLLDPPQAQRLKEIDGRELAQAVADIGLCLLGMGISFAASPQPITWVGMSTSVFREDMSRKDLIAAIELIRRGFQVVLLMMAKILGELPAPLPESEQSVH